MDNLLKLVDLFIRVVALVALVLLVLAMLDVLPVGLISSSVISIARPTDLSLSTGLLFLFVTVLVAYPLVAWGLRLKRITVGILPDERALSLPNGSIRAMLALLTVGAFVLVLGAAADDHFEEVVTAFGTLTGSMIGFYFGIRAAQKKPDTNSGDGSPTIAVLMGILRGRTMKRDDLLKKCKDYGVDHDAAVEALEQAIAKDLVEKKNGDVMAKDP